MYVSIETTPLVSAGGLREATGVSLVKVDEQGRFLIPEIADGRVEVSANCDKRLPVRVRLPGPGALTLLASETGSVEISLEMAVKVRGLVRAKETQKPLAGVGLSVRYGVGQQGDQAVTDANGEFSALALPGEVYIHLIGLPEEYLQIGEPWKDKRTVPADAKEYNWPPIEVAPSTKIAGKLIDREGKPMANVRINGIVGNRRYGFGETDKDGLFTLRAVPKEIQLESFGIWTRDERLNGVIDSTDPLVVRAQ
jgi:hypothetical protein